MTDATEIAARTRAVLWLREYAKDQAADSLDTPPEGFTAWGAADIIEHQAAEIARLQAGGCARDQRLTQFCAEAAAFAKEAAELRAEVERLRNPWRPVDDEARNGEEWAVQTARGMIFKAQWMPNIVVNEHGEDVGAWVACDEDVRPACWTDCICWASNEDDAPSDPPVAYASLPPPPVTEPSVPVDSMDREN